MTSFLDPQLAASKASRKERRQAARPSESDATTRAFATFQRAVGRDFRKADNEERLIAKAISDTMPELISAMDEDPLAAFFFALERVATAPNRRRIAKHPLRPEIVDEMHEEADKEDARVAEEAAKAEAEAEARAAKEAGDMVSDAAAMPTGDASNGEAAQ